MNGGGHMQRNIGFLDRSIRFTVTMACVYLAFQRPAYDLWFWVLCGVGAVALLTALTSWCGLYAALGISTREKKGDRDLEK